MKFKYVLNFSFIILCGCSLFEDTEEKKLLMAVFDEPAGVSCEFGGVRVGSGMDNNLNHKLDVEEVISEYILLLIYFA